MNTFSPLGEKIEATRHIESCLHPLFDAVQKCYLPPKTTLSFEITESISAALSKGKMTTTTLRKGDWKLR